MFPPEQADLESKGIKAFSDVCIVQDKTRRVSSVIYHIHEVKKNKNKNLKTNVLRAKLCSKVIALLWSKENIQ